MTATEFDPDRIDPNKTFYITVDQSSDDGAISLQDFATRAFGDLEAAITSARDEVEEFNFPIYVFEVLPRRRVRPLNRTATDDLTARPTLGKPFQGWNNTTEIRDMPTKKG